MDPVNYIFANIHVTQQETIGNYTFNFNTYTPSLGMNYHLNGQLVPPNTTLTNFAAMFAQKMKLLDGNGNECLSIRANITSPNATTVGTMIQFNNMIAALAPEIASIFNVVALKLLDQGNDYASGLALFNACKTFLSNIDYPGDDDMSYTHQGETRDVTIRNFLRALGQMDNNQLALYNVNATISTHPENQTLIALRNNYASNRLTEFLELAIYSLVPQDLTIPEERSYINQFAHGKYAEQFYDEHPEGYVVLKPGYTIHNDYIAPVTNRTIGNNGRKHIVLYYLQRVNGTYIMRSVIVV